MEALQTITIVVGVVGAVAAGLAAAFAGSQAMAATRQARYAQGQLALAEQVRKDQAQPYVFVDLAPDEHDPQKLMLVVQNTGMTVAHNIRVTFDPPLQSVTRPDFAETTPALLAPISALPPGRRVRWFWEIGFRLFENLQIPRSYTVTVNADGPFGTVGELIYEIDLDNLRYSDATAPASKKLVDELQKSRKALEKISQKVD
ncbi:hypothetical protein SAMN05444365_1058 [Micromonospora pattaloongensis]|uniref:Uncharacterized protein n=1 Tax=Micromonospora pattaloongensis TaxID=405436 RepID=A0A1H3PSY4_9ACTN|nr:hypothetical protein [Micromonospora pattaloongensis]SDZ04227.1 hypothetical protein SAMN05444365_1058 [Micromonospora pattaloongensis]